MNDSFPLLEEIADRLAVLRTPPEPFDEASIPSEENAQATFKGTIQLGKGTILEFKTSVRTAGFPDENTCWLKIDVDSGEEGKLFDSPMTAWVLVSKTWAKDDGLKITRGWLEVEGEVLPFDGSEAPVEESLFKLGKSLTPSRLRVQQVLSLLFNAKLAGAGNLTGLRTSIDTAINRAGQKDRVHSVEEIKDPSGDSVTCEVWKVSEAAGLGFTYTIRRSRWIPFNFLSVDFASDKLNIYTKRVWQDSPIVVPPPFDEAALITLAGETQGKIDGTASPPDKDNQRIWRDKDGKIMFWGEFAGHPDGLKKRMVVLKSTDGTPSRVYPIEDFSEADKVWIEEGRHLRDVNGKALSLLPETGNRNPTNRAIYISFSEKTGVNFRYKNTPLKPVKMESLDARDQEWIRWWRAYKK